MSENISSRKKQIKKTESVPVFELYGENEQWFNPDLIHCESIEARSKLHNWQIKPHKHLGLYQLLYLEAGSACIQLDDQHRTMQAGQVLLVPQRCIHGFQFDENANGFIITIAYPLIIAIGKKLGVALAVTQSPSLHCLGSDDDGVLIKLAFKVLDNEYRLQAPHKNQLMESMLMTILIWASRDSLDLSLKNTPEQNNGIKHFIHFVRMIEECYASKHLVAQYARSIGITAAHLNVIAREQTGKSALVLIHERMLLEAKRNLAYTTMTVSTIAYALGFADPAYFTRFFKRHANISPKNFRKQAGTLFAVD